MVRVRMISPVVAWMTRVVAVDEQNEGGSVEGSPEADVVHGSV